MPTTPLTPTPPQRLPITDDGAEADALAWALADLAQAAARAAGRMVDDAHAVRVDWQGPTRWTFDGRIEALIEQLQRAVTTSGDDLRAVRADQARRAARRAEEARLAELAALAGAAVPTGPTAVLNPRLGGAGS